MKRERGRFPSAQLAGVTLPELAELPLAVDGISVRNGVRRFSRKARRKVGVLWRLVMVHFLAGVFGKLRLLRRCLTRHRRMFLPQRPLLRRAVAASTATDRTTPGSITVAAASAAIDGSPTKGTFGLITVFQPQAS